MGSLGKSDYPTTYPLREVFVIAKHCSGGVILGFSQFEVSGGIWRRGSNSTAQSRVDGVRQKTHQALRKQVENAFCTSNCILRLGNAIENRNLLRVPNLRAKRETTLRCTAKTERRQRGNLTFPTPWNQLEAGILFSRGLPLLVFCENGVKGGIFDHGVTDVFIHPMPAGKMSKLQTDGLREVILKWSAKVRQHYYGEPNQVSGQSP